MVSKYYTLTNHDCLSSKKTTNLISRILFLNYHLSGPAITGGILLPTLDLGRAALKRSYTWHYSTQGLPVLTVTNQNCELLPHIFTFSPCRVVIFCGTIALPIFTGRPALHRWVALRCPDFPSFRLSRKNDSSGL